MYRLLQKFSSLFHQDILSIHSSFEDAVEDVLASFNGMERSGLAGDLSAILNDNDISFLKTWKEVGSPFGFTSESDAREFLRQLYEIVRI
jgi:hypothetical protein